MCRRWKSDILNEFPTSQLIHDVGPRPSTPTLHSQYGKSCILIFFALFQYLRSVLFTYRCFRTAELNFKVHGKVIQYHNKSLLPTINLLNWLLNCSPNIKSRSTYKLPPHWLANYWILHFYWHTVENDSCHGELLACMSNVASPRKCTTKNQYQR